MDNSIVARVSAEFNRRAPFTLEQATLLVLGKRGSHAYGTAGPDSDEDFMGVIVPPISWKLGFQAPWEGVEFIHEGMDCVFYTLDKFVRLLVKASPNCLELLWTRPEALPVQHPLWGRFTRNRRAFSSQRVRNSFSGMARSKSTTNLVHPLRLMRMCVEFLATGTLQVYREQDADYLRAVKQGRVPEGEVLAETDALIARAAGMASVLPQMPDYPRIDTLTRSIHLHLYTCEPPTTTV